MKVLIAVLTVLISGFIGMTVDYPETGGAKFWFLGGISGFIAGIILSC